MAKKMVNPKLYDLARTLAMIKLNEGNYEVRNQCVYEAIWLAHACGFAAGTRIDASDPSWPIAYIELPNGQVSWHVPEHAKHWDGHSVDIKYRRIENWTKTLSPHDEPSRGRRFWLHRVRDASGVSGTGIVAVGFESEPGGKCTLHWLRSGCSIGIYDDIYMLTRIHGHGGATVVEWLDQ